MRITRLHRFESLERRELLAADVVSMRSFVVETAETIELTSQSLVAAEQADLNQDGKLDWILGESRFQNSTNLEIFLRQDGGGFDNNASLRVSGDIFSIDVTDFDNDGMPDIVVGATDRFQVYMNRGNRDGGWLGLDRSFENRTDVRSIAIADINGDGLEDLVVGTNDDFRIHHGDGTGRFNEPVEFNGKQSDRIVAAADVNGDGHVDLGVGVTWPGNRVDILLNDGNGLFESVSHSVDVAHSPSMVSFLDVDADGVLDLVYGESLREGGEENLFIAHGNADGTFNEARGYEVAGPPEFVELGDFDVDGHVDLIVADSGTFHHILLGNGPGGVSVLAGLTGGFANPVRITSTNAVFLDVADSRITVVHSYSNAENITTLRRGDATLFAGDGAFYQIAEPGFSVNASNAYVDLNNDGLMDTLSVDLWGDDARFRSFLQDIDGTFLRLTEGAKIGFEHNAPVTGDFNNDGLADFVLSQTDGQSAIQAWLGNGDGTFQMPIRSNPSISYRFWWSADSADFNNDGFDDLLVRSSGSANIPELWVSLSNGDGRFQRRMKLPFGENHWVADMDADGVLDIVTMNEKQTSLLKGNGDGSFDTLLNVPRPATSAAVVDLDRDGRSEVVVADEGTGRLEVFVRDDSNGFESADRATLLRPRILAASDVDRDGNTEIVVGINTDGFAFEADSSIRVMRWTIDGFRVVDEVPLAAPIGSVHRIDVDGDGQLDLLMQQQGNFISAPAAAEFWIAYQRADGFEISADRLIVGVAGGNPVTSLDVDGDGDMDLLLENRFGFGVLPLEQPLPHTDFNQDGRTGAEDIDLLWGIARTPDPTADEVARFDLNQDGVVTKQDVDYLVEDILGTVFGDANLNGRTEFDDFLQLSANYGQSERGWSEADFNGDANVDFQDFLLLSAYFGAVVNV